MSKFKTMVRKDIELCDKYMKENPNAKNELSQVSFKNGLIKRLKLILIVILKLNVASKIPLIRIVKIKFLQRDLYRQELLH